MGFDPVEIEKQKLRHIKLEFVVTMPCEVTVNGLGEVVTTHVQACLLSHKQGQKEHQIATLREGAQEFAELVLTQALVNAKKNRAGDESEPDSSSSIIQG